MAEVSRRNAAGGPSRRRRRGAPGPARVAAGTVTTWLVVAGAVDRWPYLRAAGLGAGVLLATVARLH